MKSTESIEKGTCAALHGHASSRDSRCRSASPPRGETLPCRPHPELTELPACRESDRSCSSYGWPPLLLLEPKEACCVRPVVRPGPACRRPVVVVAPLPPPIVIFMLVIFTAPARTAGRREGLVLLLFLLPPLRGGNGPRWLKATMRQTAVPPYPRCASSSRRDWPLWGWTTERGRSRCRSCCWQGVSSLALGLVLAGEHGQIEKLLPRSDSSSPTRTTGTGGGLAPARGPRSSAAGVLLLHLHPPTCNVGRHRELALCTCGQNLHVD